MNFDSGLVLLLFFPVLAALLAIAPFLLGRLIRWVITGLFGGPG